MNVFWCISLPFPVGLQAAFAFSLVWSIGGCCDADSREKFNDFVREMLSGKSTEHPIPATVKKWECPMDESGLVYDYFYEVLGFVAPGCFAFA